MLLSLIRAAGDPPQAWLGWSAVSGAASYRILREGNQPYFAADPTTQTFWPRTTPEFYDPAAATGDVNVNHFYLIQALDAAGAVIGEAGRQGEFTFGLAPGQP